VLAHPRDIDGLDRNLQDMVSAHLAGMEVFYGSYTASTVASLKEKAEAFGLVPCGGSDFHGINPADEILPGEVGPPLESVAALKRLLGHAGPGAKRTSSR
jgi:hypothetical protein